MCDHQLDHQRKWRAFADRLPLTGFPIGVAMLATGNIAGLLFVAYSIFYRRQAAARGMLTAFGIAYLLHDVASPAYVSVFSVAMGLLVMLSRVPVVLVLALSALPL